MSFKKILQKRAKKASSPKVLWKLSPYQIIGNPIITEKAYKKVENFNTYTFRVHKDANKQDVRYSLQAIYNVNPVTIRLMNVPYKWRARRALVRRAYKKAEVRLNVWDKIELAW